MKKTQPTKNKVKKYISTRIMRHSYIARVADYNSQTSIPDTSQKLWHTYTLERRDYART